MAADLDIQPMRTCPVCHGQFAITHASTARHTYCSRRCRDIAANARDKAKDAEAEARLAAAGGSATILAAISRGRTATSSTRPALEPAATRPCPHCGESITIVALLTTPEAARPQLPAAASEVVPIRRGG